MTTNEILRVIDNAIARYKFIIPTEPKHLVMMTKHFKQLQADEHLEPSLPNAYPTIRGLLVLTVPYDIKPSVVFNHE